MDSVLSVHTTTVGEALPRPTGRGMVAKACDDRQTAAKPLANAKLRGFGTRLCNEMPLRHLWLSGHR
jgi:hypothetical protein